MKDTGRGLEYGITAARVCYRLTKAALQAGGVVALRPAARLADGLTPDLIYLTAATLQRINNLEAPMQAPPDLVVDIVPADAAWTEVEAIALRYVELGVPLIWIVDPYSLCVHVYGSGRDNEIFTGPEILPGDQVLPGWNDAAADLLG